MHGDPYVLHHKDIEFLIVKISNKKNFRQNTLQNSTFMSLITMGIRNMHPHDLLRILMHSPKTVVKGTETERKKRGIKTNFWQTISE